MQINPKSSEACNNLGNALVKTFDYPAALEAYEQALRTIKPNDPEPRYNLEARYTVCASLAGRLWYWIEHLSCGRIISRRVTRGRFRRYCLAISARLA